MSMPQEGFETANPGVRAYENITRFRKSGYCRKNTRSLQFKVLK
jgi:hypothetical protein